MTCKTRWDAQSDATALWTTQSGASTAWASDCVPSALVAPYIDSLDPPSGAAGTTVTVTLSGAAFSAVSTIAVSGAGVTAQNVVVHSDTLLTADLVIAQGATISARTVTVTTEWGASNAAAFSVTASTPLQLKSIASWALILDATAGLTLSGGNIGTLIDTSGNTVTVSLPDGAIASSATKWRSAQSAWAFDATTKHRIQIGGDATWSTLTKPFTVFSVMDGLTDDGSHDGNIYRDNTQVASVGFINHANGKSWSLYDGTVFDSTFNASNRSGPTVRVDVHNGASSAIWANGTKQTGNAGTTARNLGTFYIGSNSANNAPVGGTQAFFGIVASALTDGDITSIVTVLRSMFTGIPAT